MRERWGSGVQAVRTHPAALRLSLVRFAAQFGDGVFQAALSGAILFNPERETDPAAIAAGFAVLLLPYSLIGPYAGALLDRWDRRRVLLGASLLRLLLIVAVSLSLLGGASSELLLIGALAVVGISRFVSAGVSAALPLVLPARLLVPMNSVLATVASGCAAGGAAVAVGVIGAFGAGDSASAIAVAVAGSGPLLGALLVAGFPPGRLGPGAEFGPVSGLGLGTGTSTGADLDRRPGPERDADIGAGAQRRRAVRADLLAVAAGLRTGAVAVWRSPEVTTAMFGIGAHRVVFGMNTLVMVLVLRRPDSGEAGVGSGLLGFGVAIGVTAAGMLLAAVLTPLLIPRLGRPRTVLAGLVLATVVQLTLVTPIAVAAAGPAAQRAQYLLLAGAFLLGLAGQTIKLTGDATMQLDIDDTHRGQVFALQDTVFNITFVLALAATATVVPADGRSLPVVLAGAGCYLAGIAAVLLTGRRARAEVRPAARADTGRAARRYPARPKQAR
ncbi:hypothetical protein LTT61_18450 [Nocardia asteroides]|nr:hypothetical protein [Nocardia asteroides]UGT65015.1 hypothetical protein LTT61_18450 [Nocardia asteroides]